MGSSIFYIWKTTLHKDENKLSQLSEHNGDLSCERQSEDEV